MRRKPYTNNGIRRVKCFKRGCNERGNQQWQICADKRVFRPICTKHDIEMNRIVLKFLGDPNIFKKMSEYRQKIAS